MKIVMSAVLGGCLWLAPLEAVFGAVADKISHEAIGSAVAEAAGELPTTAFDERCPHPFEKDALGRYLRTAADGDFEAARGRLYDLYFQLRCVSARRFADLHGVLRRVVLEADVDDETRQMLAPVALLFYELGYGAFRFEILRWLIENAEDLERADEDEGSTFSRIGLYVAVGGRLWEMSGEDRGLVLGSAGDLAFSLGDCSLAEMVELEDEDGEVTLFCPRACGFDVAEDVAGDSDLDLRAWLSPEAQEICERYNEARANKPRPSHATLECLNDFVEEAGDDVLACEVDRFAVRGALLADFDTEWTRDDIYAARRCFRSQDSEIGRALRERDRFIEAGLAAKAARETAVEALERVGEELARLEADLTAAHGDRSDWPTEAEAVVERLERAAADIAQEIEEIDQLIQNAIDRIEALTDQIDQLASEARCAPDAEGCSDHCSIFDQMVQESSACWSQAYAPQLPDRGGLPQGPISRPDPRDPDELPEAAVRLRQCLLETSGRDREPEQPRSRCPDYTRCPNGEMPNGENCTCGVDQRFTDVPSGCLLVARCTDGQAVCCPRRIDPEDTRGGTGVLPGTPGDPSPVGERWRLWTSDSLWDVPRVPEA